jgi:hypothetical protein
MLRQQTVSEHSWRVAVIAEALAIGIGLGKEASGVAPIVYMAVVHDIDEVFTGDIPATMKTPVPVTEMLSSALVVKVADQIEAMTWMEMWGHDRVKLDILPGAEERYIALVNELEVRCKGAKDVAFRVYQEVLDGRD